MAEQPIGQPPIELPLQLRSLNAAGPAFQRLGLCNIHEDPDYYLRWAQRKTGLTDFGPYDLREPLERLLYTLKNETGLSLFGRIATLQMLRRNLVNNLMMQQEFMTRPELAQVDVDEPLIIICTPRTGSTLLHNLLAEHPEVRAPRMWELHRPCPAPVPELEGRDPRIRQSDREFGMFYRLVPEMRAIHFFAPEAIEECTHLFGNIFTCRISFSTMANRSSYTDWIMQHDMTEAYRAYKRHLQILKLNYPGKILILKSPAHILALDALAEVFPKARLVHLHRDPVTAAGSFCSLTEAVQISMREKVDPRSIGGMWKEFWTPTMLDSIAWRKSGKLNVLDIDFRQLISDPVDTVTSTFQKFGWDVPDALETGINEYLAQHPKDEYGSHAYSLERYGLNREELYEEYADYIDYFGVSLESGRGTVLKAP